MGQRSDRNGGCLKWIIGTLITLLAAGAGVGYWVDAVKWVFPSAPEQWTGVGRQFGKTPSEQEIFIRHNVAPKIDGEKVSGSIAGDDRKWEIVGFERSGFLVLSYITHIAQVKRGQGVGVYFLRTKMAAVSTTPGSGKAAIATSSESSDVHMCSADVLRAKHRRNGKNCSLETAKS